MKTKIKPYVTTGNQEHDQHKSNFVLLFSQMFFNSIKQDEDYQRVCQISEKLRTKSGLTTASVKRYAPEQPRTVRYHKQIKIRVIPNWTPPKA